jgi:hypothetical protein
VRTVLSILVAAALGGCAPGREAASGRGPAAGARQAFEVTLTVPETIAAGKLFTFVVEVRNPHDAALTLDRIDLADALAAPLQLVSVQPMPQRMRQAGGAHSWIFGEKVAPRASLRVVYRLRAPREGRFGGTVEACTPRPDCGSAPAELVVGPPPA